MERLACLLDAVPALLTELGPHGLACLAASSKSLQQTVEVLSCREGVVLLDAAVARARSTSTEWQHMQAAGWLGPLLLRKAPANAEDVTRRLINLPAVPLAVAEQLVAAGMCITYAQLLAAADSMVAGVEVWVQAQQQLGVQSDIPAGAVTVCCSKTTADIFSAVKHSGSDLLQLAMHCSRDAVMAAPLCCLPHTIEACQLGPGMARKLLLTAAARQNTVAVQYMARVDPFKQHADAAALEAMLKHHVPINNNNHYACTRVLCKLPAAAELSTDALAELARVALSSRSYFSAQELLRLPAAQQLSSEAVLQLMQAAIQHDGVLAQLCRLPAAAGIGSAALLELLHAAVGKGSWASVGALCAVPAVVQLSSEGALALLSAAVKAESPRTLQALCTQLPPVLLKRISSQQMAQLLAAAKEQGSECRAALRSVQTQLAGGSAAAGQ